MSGTLRQKRIAATLRGYALLAALVVVALVSLAAGVAVQSQRQQAQREREAQLLFVGAQFRDALLSYNSVPGRAAQFPESLQELLHDRRSPTVLRHLRRIYVDPMTGQADWVLVRQQGRIVGIHSRSSAAPLKSAGFAMADRGFSDATSYLQWRFMAMSGAVDTVGGQTALADPTGKPQSPAPADPQSPAATVPTESTPSTPDPTPPPERNPANVGDCMQLFIYPQNDCGGVPPPQGTDYASCRAAYQTLFENCAAAVR